jgi:hypothetical protein
MWWVVGLKELLLRSAPFLQLLQDLELDPVVIRRGRKPTSTQEEVDEGENTNRRDQH